jgi:hypothetical protein
MSTNIRDPREIITPDAFSVAPELLGTPLARPWRRGAAMAIDLVAVVILGSAGWLFLGLAIAFLCFRAALRRRAGLLNRGTRLVIFGSLGVLVLVVTLSATWWTRFSSGDGPVTVDAGDVVSSIGLGEAGGAVADVLKMNRAESEAEFRDAAERFAERLQRQGVDAASIRDALEGVAAEKEEPWAEDAVLAALAAAELDSVRTDEAAPPTDSLAIRYAAALEGRDSAGAAALREPLAAALAAERLERQQRRIERLETANRNLENDLENERDRGLIHLILRSADEVGLGFGWAGLYFTLFVAVWSGRTPGKRLLGIRIVRLDGKPISLWVSFNRFGGYAASIFTGLLGFFEMFWDANRQALHDRIAATVVVREHGSRAKPD